MSKITVIAVLTLCLAAQASGACPAGWKSFNHHCYIFQTEIMNWVDARTMCKWHQSDLMAVESQAEQDFLYREALKFNHTDVDSGFWLSATLWNMNTWVWESTGQGFGFTNWADSQPNNRNNSEHCLASMLYFNYKWSDEFCNWNHLQYVCEKDETSGPIVG